MLRHQLTARVVVFTAVASAAAGASFAQSPDRVVGVAEDGLRRAAVDARAPEYPAASTQRKSSGVAVAAVTFGADGRTSDVRVLEAPDAEIAKSVESAVRGWTWTPFRVANRPEPYGARGKLTFYFRLDGGKPRVVAPDFPERPKPKPSAGGGAAPEVHHGHHGANATEVNEQQLKQLVPAPVVLDIGERDAFKREHRPGAINIPRDELPSRARMELDPKKSYVIDCTRDERTWCLFANDVLRDSGFSRVSLLVR